MLKINNLQKKILKISTVISLVMISSFFLINKVSASNTGFQPFDKSLSDFSNLELKDEDIQNYISTLGLDSSYNGYLFIIYPDAYSRYRHALYIFPKEVAEDSSIYLNGTTSIKGGSVSSGATSFTAYYVNSGTNYVTYVGNAKNKTSFNDFQYSGSMSSFKNSNNVNFQYSTEDIDSPIWYFSNVDIYDSITNSWLSANAVNKTYEFNEDIDVTEISKIKINFELPEDTSNLEVDIKWTFDNYSSNSSGYITTPYLEFKHSNGDISLSQDIFNLNGGDWFSDDYIATLLPDSDITEISLIVDTVKASGLLKVNFSSKFPYSISYEYTEEIEDYFITIDMDDYASISLIPKVHNLENGISSSISSPIYKYGIYDVEIWEDLETKKVIDRWDNHSTSQFIYPMYSGYKNCVIHFIKKEVDSAKEKYIKFDSRYYSYVLKKYLNEEVTIINPNTNENITIPDTSDLYKYDSPIDKRFSFNSFLKPIKFVFESITDFYNNYCPEVVQYFFYLIFAFFVILVLIKIFL